MVASILELALGHCRRMLGLVLDRALGGDALALRSALLAQATPRSAAAQGALSSTSDRP